MADCIETAQDYCETILREVVTLSDGLEAAAFDDVQGLLCALRELELDEDEDATVTPFDLFVMWLNTSCLDVQGPDDDWPTGSVLRTCGGPHAEIGLAEGSADSVAVRVWWGYEKAYRSVRAPLLAGLLSDVFESVSV